MLTRLILALSLGSALALVLLAGLAQDPVQAESPSPPPGRYSLPPTPPAPDLGFPRPPLAKSGRPSGGVSDLSIHFISRTPRYERYCLDYAHDAPELCEGTENEKRFPDPGETVTFTARIANQGAVSTTTTTFTWLLDGVEQATGVLPALGPGAKQDLNWNWAWQSETHTVTLSLEDDGELTTANNTLDHRTDAHYLEILVHPYFVQAFAQTQNFVGSYSFHDWLQAQFVQMNQRLAEAVYPDAPNGIADRIRIDVITETVKVGGNEVVGNLAYDGRWTFRTERDYKRTPEDEAWISALNYARRFANGIDWGLIHELTHQLGVIDLYQLNVSPSAGNEVLDQEGLPLLSGFYWPHPGLMGGDSSWPYDTTSHYSEHTAMALNQNTGYRRGYFGDYLFDLPTEISLRVLDREGRPVAGATVEAYQTQRNVVGAEPVIVGKTDADGMFPLLNRPVSPTLTTATGHLFGPNPYGHIDVVGRNGQMLLRVRKDDQELFRWLPITEMNKAAWRGESAIAIVPETHFPAAASPSPPTRLSIRTEGWENILQWEAAPEAESYNIYRADWPDYQPYELIAGDLFSTTWTAWHHTSARYAVTAVSENDRESGFSNIARAEMLHAPGGLVWEPSSPYTDRGELLVVDRHSGAQLQMLPPLETDLSDPPRWLGRVGSEHHGMVGATAATLGPGETVAVALGSGQRLWVFDHKQQPLNWFGLVSDRPSPLDQPAGVALLGQPFTVDFPHARPDPDASLLLPFDGDLTDPNGLQPSVAEGVSFTQGRFGQAVEIGEGSRLQYPLGNFSADRGSVEFWAKPNWSGTDKNHHVLLEIGDPNRDPESEEPGYRLRLAHENGGMYVWVTDFEDIDKAAWEQVADWQPDQWHHIAATWNEQRLNLHVDGRLLWGEALPFTIEGSPTFLAVGATLNGEDTADAAFDALRISTLPRLGNSEHFRTLVSEAGTGEIKVFDLLGNLISTFVPDDDGLHDYGQLAATSASDVWVIDRHTRSVEQLFFDGETLRRRRTLNLAPLDDPRALTANAEGILALADADRILILDPARANPVLGVWLAPTASSSGPFQRPTALAFGPDGDLAVAEGGSRRISFIADAMESDRLWLPVILNNN